MEFLALCVSMCVCLFLSLLFCLLEREMSKHQMESASDSTLRTANELQGQAGCQPMSEGILLYKPSCPLSMSSCQVQGGHRGSRPTAWVEGQQAEVDMGCLWQPAPEGTPHRILSSTHCPSVPPPQCRSQAHKEKGRGLHLGHGYVALALGSQRPAGSLADSTPLPHHASS